MENLLIFKRGQTSPSPFVRYGSKDLADPARRARILQFWTGKPGYSCKLVDTETGKHTAV